MARQQQIPGTERKVDKDVASAALAYVTERDRRMKLTKKEKAAKDGLIQVMKKKNILSYRDDEANPPVVVTLSSKDDVKVTKVEDDDGDESDDGGEAQRN
jgi:hypothetical protein